MLSDFEVLDVISTKGKKNNTKILKARKANTGETVCLKTFKSHKFSVVQEALHEAKVLMTASKTHKNICEMQDCFVEQIHDFYQFGIVMQHFDHGDLEDEIKKRKRTNRPWTEDELKIVFEELLDALNMLQKGKICHRDLKPQNIFIQSETFYKIGDFGLSRKEEFGRLNSSKSLVGTPIYFSPLCAQAYLEHQIGGDLRVRHNMYKSDVFSLGLTFLRMASLSSIRGLNCSPQDNIESKISSLNYGSSIRGLLHYMLRVDEHQRPDFITLPLISQELNSIMLSIQPEFIKEENFEILNSEISELILEAEKLEKKNEPSEKKILENWDNETLDSFGLYSDESIKVFEAEELSMPEFEKVARFGKSEEENTPNCKSEDGDGKCTDDLDRVLEFLVIKPELLIVKDSSIYLS